MPISRRQVTTSSVLLLSGSVLVHSLSVSLGSALVAASIADPYVVVCSEDGQVALVTLTGDRLRLSVPNVDTNGRWGGATGGGGGVTVGGESHGRWGEPREVGRSHGRWGRGHSRRGRRRCSGPRQDCRRW